MSFAFVGWCGMNVKPWGTERPRLNSRLLESLDRKLLRGKLHKAAYKRLLATGSVMDVEVDGLKFRANFRDNNVERDIVFRGSRDRGNIESITRTLKPGDTFIDIGANCGVYSLYAARKVGHEGRVIAIEPIPEMARRLRENIIFNSFENITVVEAAVGDAPGTIPLFINTASWGESSAADKVGNAVAEVPVRTLPDILVQNSIDRIGALKIDIEGYEDRALLPIIRTLPQKLWPRRILMEIAHAYRWAEPCLRLLIAAGYRCMNTGPEDALLEFNAP